MSYAIQSWMYVPLNYLHFSQNKYLNLCFYPFSKDIVYCSEANNKDVTSSERLQYRYLIWNRVTAPIKIVNPLSMDVPCCEKYKYWTWNCLICDIYLHLFKIIISILQYINGMVSYYFHNRNTLSYVFCWITSPIMLTYL